MNECNPPRSVSNRLQVVPSNMFAVAGQPDIDAVAGTRGDRMPRKGRYQRRLGGGWRGDGHWTALRPQSLAPAPSFWVVGLVDFGWLFRPFHANPPSLAFSRFFHVGVSVLRSKNATMLNYNPRTAGGLRHLRMAGGGGR